MNKMTVRDIDLKGKRVLVRVDFNLPLEGNKITDDTRIRAAVPTLKYILDQHPKAENVWILGGGSGHGFKHGPAFGLKAAQAVLEIHPPEEELRLQRWLQK